jgi:hypothetical protein
MPESDFLFGSSLHRFAGSAKVLQGSDVIRWFGQPNSEAMQRCMDQVLPQFATPVRCAAAGMEIDDVQCVPKNSCIFALRAGELG